MFFIEKLVVNHEVSLDHRIESAIRLLPHTVGIIVEKGVVLPPLVFFSLRRQLNAVVFHGQVLDHSLNVEVAALRVEQL